MIRPATLADLPRILEIRDNAGDNPLSNPRALTDALARRLVDNGAVWVWQAPGDEMAGFAAIDVAEARIVALLVAPGDESRGIGRALLATASDALREAGHASATIALEPDSAAPRHYRAAGWTVADVTAEGALIFQQPL